MQGIFIDGRRPKSKAELKRHLADGKGLSLISIEATSLFGDEYDGTLALAPENTVINFVGPDPYTNRKFYGTITLRNGNVTIK